MPQPWKKIRSTLLGDFRLFTLRSDVKISPRTGREHDFLVLDSVPWVNVIALTPDDHLVMVEQFRHGSNTVELEIPGGMMEAARVTPSPPPRANCVRKPATPAKRRASWEKSGPIPPS